MSLNGLKQLSEMPPQASAFSDALAASSTAAAGAQLARLRIRNVSVVASASVTVAAVAFYALGLSGQPPEVVPPISPSATTQSSKPAVTSSNTPSETPTPTPSQTPSASETTTPGPETTPRRAEEIPGESPDIAQPGTDPTITENQQPEQPAPGVPACSASSFGQPSITTVSAPVSTQPGVWASQYSIFIPNLSGQPCTLAADTQLSYEVQHVAEHTLAAGNRNLSGTIPAEGQTVVITHNTDSQPTGRIVNADFNIALGAYGEWTVQHSQWYE